MVDSIQLRACLFRGLLGLLIILDSCEPIATKFNTEEEAQYYEAASKTIPADTFSRVKVMTWNIRFGAGRRPWFGDACGNNVVFSSDEILYTLQKIVDKINEIQPDILFLQEVDLSSKRSAYIDEVRYILNHSYFNYAVSAFQWKAQFIPSDGLGRLEETNMILSRWSIDNAVRIQLPLRTDQGSLVRYFYERCCILKCRLLIPKTDGVFALNIHASAFATDDTKWRHIQVLQSEMDSIHNHGGYFIAGGDLNTLPPGSDTTDYCLQDMCPGESFHQIGDNPYHKDGSNYTPEGDWLTPIYFQYNSVIPLANFQANQYKYFSHTTRPTHFWDRTLDYLFSNSDWKPGSGIVHQEAQEHSDHAPVSGILYLPIIAK
jgi:endonuclease/exonuclease/phosphatase family metal-dependent hydrolase